MAAAAPHDGVRATFACLWRLDDAGRIAASDVRPQQSALDSTAFGAPKYESFHSSNLIHRRKNIWIKRYFPECRPGREALRNDDDQGQEEDRRYQEFTETPPVLKKLA